MQDQLTAASIDASPFFLILGAICLAVVVAVYAFSPMFERRRDARLLKAHSGIWRVRAVPTDERILVVAEDARIAVGDFGWEAEPIHIDGLIYLHGLTREWKVQWYAAFSPDEIELVGSKPCSQYYRYPYWVSAPAETCPFPVMSHCIQNLGYPVEIEDDWIQGVTVRGVKRRVRERQDNKNSSQKGNGVTS